MVSSVHIHYHHDFIICTQRYIGTYIYLSGQWYILVELRADRRQRSQKGHLDKVRRRGGRGHSILLHKYRRRKPLQIWIGDRGQNRGIPPPPPPLTQAQRRCKDIIRLCIRQIRHMRVYAVYMRRVGPIRREYACNPRGVCHTSFPETRGSTSCGTGASS